MDNKESSYIRKRKLKAFRESLLYYIFRIFPIRKNRIAVTTFEGKGGFCCNPKYIVKELHKRNSELEFIWLVNDPKSKEFPDYIRKVKNDIWHRAYYLTTSKVWIDNYRKPLGTKKRRGQFYVNTWHGSLAFKRLGLLRGEGFSKIAYLVSKDDSDMIDALIVSSEWSVQAFRKGLVYDGDFFKLGQAREDILYQRDEEKIREVKVSLGISVNTHVVLYVPTFREKHQDTDRSVFSEQSSINLEQIRQELESRFGGEWMVLLKLHPQLAANHKSNNISDNELDVTLYDDVYELMLISDAVITDYSSLAFEAGGACIPTFLYMDDLDEYISQRGGLCFKINENKKFVTDKSITPDIDAELPFSIATNNAEMIQNIQRFDREEYNEGCNKMISDLGIFLDGNASERAADMIEKVLA